MLDIIACYLALIERRVVVKNFTLFLFIQTKKHNIHTTKYLFSNYSLLFWLQKKWWCGYGTYNYSTFRLLGQILGIGFIIKGFRFDPRPTSLERYPFKSWCFDRLKIIVSSEDIFNLKAIGSSSSWLLKSHLLSWTF